MNSKKPTKPFGFGFSQSGSASKSKSILELEQQRQKPPSLDYFSDEEIQPKKRKLIKLEDSLEKQPAASSNTYEGYVGDLEDDRLPPPRTSTGLTLIYSFHLMFLFFRIYANIMYNRNSRFCTPRLWCC